MRPDPYRYLRDMTLGDLSATFYAWRSIRGQIPIVLALPSIRNTCRCDACRDKINSLYRFQASIHIDCHYRFDTGQASAF